jgi:hypothetical protein
LRFLLPCFPAPPSQVPGHVRLARSVAGRFPGHKTLAAAEQ